MVSTPWDRSASSEAASLNRATPITRRPGADGVGGAAGHPGEGRPHLAGDAQDDQVAFEAGHRLQDPFGRRAEPIFQVVDVPDRVVDHSIPLVVSYARRTSLSPSPAPSSPRAGPGPRRRPPRGSFARTPGSASGRGPRPTRRPRRGPSGCRRSPAARRAAGPRRRAMPARVRLGDARPDLIGRRARPPQDEAADRPADRPRHEAF